MKQIHRSEVKGQRSVLLTWTAGDRSPSFDDHSNHGDLQYNGRSLSAFWSSGSDLWCFHPDKDLLDPSGGGDSPMMNESRPWEDGLPPGGWGGGVSIQPLNTRPHCSLLEAF